MTEERFALAAERWMDTIFRVAYSYTRSREDADDVTQDVLLQLYRTEKEFSSEEHLKHWLIRCTINRCKSLFRSPWRRHESLEDYTESLGFEQPDYTALFLAVMRLEKHYRVPLYLHYYEGYTVKEIAQLLSLPENTVSSRLHRARAKLKQDLTEE